MLDTLYALLTGYMVKTGTDPRAFHVNSGDFDVLIGQWYPEDLDVPPDTQAELMAYRADALQRRHDTVWGIDTYAVDHIPPGEVVIVEQQEAETRAP